MPNSNQRVYDMLVRHAIGLERLKAGVIKDLLILFEEIEIDLVRKLRSLNENTVGAMVLRQILADTRAKRILSYDRLKDLLVDQLDELAIYEGSFVTEGLKRSTPLAGLIAAPSIDILVSAIHSEVRGDLLGGWIREARNADIKRVTRAIRIGIAEGETLPQIITRTGAADKRAKQAMAAVIRTTINDVTSKAREEVYKANRKYIKEIRWVSVLDNRTTAICMSRDGRVYPINEGPRPPAHVNCRSMTVPVTRLWDELSPSAKESLDALSPAQRQALGGPVPVDMKYPEWLKDQPLNIQEEALGKTRAALFRAGDLPLNKYIDPTGRFYTLKELKKKEMFSGLFKDLDV